jgi:hypothetical protein
LNWGIDFELEGGDGRAGVGHPERVTTSPVPVAGRAASVARQDTPSRGTSPLAEVFTGLLIIIASSYAIAATIDTPVLAAVYGLALGVVARHMWKSGAPRSLRWLCLIFAGTAFALAILAFIA